MSIEYAGIDVHRRRSQIAVVGADGAVRANRNVTNGVDTVLSVIGGLLAGTPVAFEAAYGWGWLVELLDDYGFEPHLVHPVRCKAIASARLKNDKVDAAILAQLLRADLLPEAWIAPHEVRWQRALLRHRFQLVRNRIHAVLADHGQDRPAGAVNGVGRVWLAELDQLPVPRQVVDDLAVLLDAIQVPIDAADIQLAAAAKADTRVEVLQRLPGVGPLTALTIVAEGDVHRFANARKLAAWAGLTPTVRGSDRTMHHAHISKQGSPWLRRILCEAAQSAKRSGEFSSFYQELWHRRGKKIATTAVARKLLTRAYHLLAAAQSEANAITIPWPLQDRECRRPRASSQHCMSRPQPRRAR